MNLFSHDVAAPYFVGAFDRADGVTTDDVNDLYDAVYRARIRANKSRSVRLDEGTADFNAMRSCLVRTADRCLFLSASKMQACMRLLSKAMTPIAHVAMYYSGFFSARAILAMLGGWYDGFGWAVEVGRERPTEQRLLVRQYSPPSGSSKASHRNFWMEYFTSVRGLSPWFPQAQYALALSPVSGNEVWMIDVRNRYNYRAARAFEHMEVHGGAFDGARMVVRGDMETQLQASTALLRFAFRLAHDLGLRSDIHQPSSPTRRAAVRRGILQAAYRSAAGFSRTLETYIQ